MENEALQSLIQRVPDEHPVLSLYLDMAVNSENKRTYQIFLQKQRADHSELDSDRPNHHREPLGQALETAERWLDANYQEANRGVALFVEVGGDWVEGMQLPVQVENKMIVSDRPVIGPLVEILSKHRHFGLALVDREHFRLAGSYLGEIQHYKDVQPDAYPTPHDIQKGGWAARDNQKYKAEEARQFFRLFASELADCDRRFDHDYWVLLGTDENVKNFREFLPRAIDERVIHSAPCSVDASDADISERLQPFFDDYSLQTEAGKVNELRDRLRTGHRAIAGVHATLEQLQEGKVESLVIARDFHKDGTQCTRCGFYLDRINGQCPYCGGELRAGVDLAESMIRLAAAQDIELEFVDPRPIEDLHGVGALLKF